MVYHWGHQGIQGLYRQVEEPTGSTSVGQGCSAQPDFGRLCHYRHKAVHCPVAKSTLHETHNHIHKIILIYHDCKDTCYATAAHNRHQLYNFIHDFLRCCTVYWLYKQPLFNCFIIIQYQQLLTHCTCKPYIVTNRHQSIAIQLVMHCLFSK